MIFSKRYIDKLFSHVSNCRFLFRNNRLILSFHLPRIEYGKVYNDFESSKLFFAFIHVYNPLIFYFIGAHFYLFTMVSTTLRFLT
jgi:hypothetical protein